MTKTAVEYILNLVIGEDEQDKIVRVKDIISKSEIKQAKEMEKEHIMDAYKADLYPCSDEDAEQYYNQTFKSE